MIQKSMTSTVDKIREERRRSAAVSHIDSFLHGIVTTTNYIIDEAKEDADVLKNSKEILEKSNKIIELTKGIKKTVVIDRLFELQRNILNKSVYKLIKVIIW